MQTKFKLFKELSQRSKTLGFKVRLVQSSVESFCVSPARFSSDYDVLETYTLDGHSYYLVDCMNYSDEKLKVFSFEDGVYLDVDEIVVY